MDLEEELGAMVDGVETLADDLDGEILHHVSVNPGTPPGRLAGALGRAHGEVRGAVERLVGEGLLEELEDFAGTYLHATAEGFERRSPGTALERQAAKVAELKDSSEHARLREVRSRLLTARNELADLQAGRLPEDADPVEVGRRIAKLQDEIRGLEAVERQRQEAAREASRKLQEAIAEELELRQRPALLRETILKNEEAERYAERGVAQARSILESKEQALVMVRRALRDQRQSLEAIGD